MLEIKAFMFGVSDTYFFPDSPPPYSTNDYWLPKKCVFKLLPTKNHLRYFKPRFKDRHQVMKLLLPSSYPLYDGMIWKLYSYQNQIWDLFDAIKHHPIVLVGPTYFQRFGKHAKLSDYHHIKIHGSIASENRDQVLDEIIQMHQTLSSRTKPPVYFFVAGSVAVYWVYHLHRKIENKFLIDVGQAFNFLFDSKSALMHREFGYSHEAKYGRRRYDIKELYGQGRFQSSMNISDNQVAFDLKLKFRDAWLEIILSIISRRLINLYKVRRRLLQAKHSLFFFFQRGSCQ